MRITVTDVNNLLSGEKLLAETADGDTVHVKYSAVENIKLELESSYRINVLIPKSKYEITDVVVCLASELAIIYVLPLVATA